MTILTQHEALARQIILERTSRRHRERPVHRHVRSALLLRRLAERLDPATMPDASARVTLERGWPRARPAAARH
ncbi:MAG: hypothetical protein L0H79_20685 [Intrasporangium sp.]|uniref:hypothetical protein n=1 Tax=Intrasporangium sp. TaxID=1925024 RepID=UPI002648E10F|nr:hypothetical protein [Intrasporangium sp.]MDN5798144.1 hypothetical protein [Intrasporangium sp.]